MHKLKIILIALPIALVLIVGGLWAYLWYSTKQQVDQLVAAAKPFADISYREIAISPAGSVGVNRVQIIINALNDSVRVGSIRLKAPNLLALLDIRSALSAGRLPAALTLALEQIEVSLDGGLLGASDATPAQRSPFGDLDALGCGPTHSLGGAEWREMGYSNLISNIEIGYRLNPAQNGIELQIDSDTRDWAAINLMLGLTTPSARPSILDLATTATPKLTQFTAMVRDGGFNQRRNDYCAKKAGKPVETYIAEHARLVVERLQANGIYLGPGLIEAYRNYLAVGSQVALTLTPPVPIDPREFQFYKPDDVIKLMGLALKVNDKPVSDLSINWASDKIAKALATKPVAESPEAATEPSRTERTPSSAAEPTIIQKSFHPIALNELSRYIGATAKVKTANGARYNARIEAIVDGMVNITIRKPSGTATLSLRRNEITEVEVLY